MSLIETLVHVLLAWLALISRMLRVGALRYLLLLICQTGCVFSRAAPSLLQLLLLQVIIVAYCVYLLGAAANEVGMIVFLLGLHGQSTFDTLSVIRLALGLQFQGLYSGTRANRLYPIRIALLHTVC